MGKAIQAANQVFLVKRWQQLQLCLSFSNNPRLSRDTEFLAIAGMDNAYLLKLKTGGGVCHSESSTEYGQS